MSVSPSAVTPPNGAAPAPRLNLSELDVAPELFALVPRKVAELHELVPVFRQNGTLTVAMARPENLVAVDELGRLTTDLVAGNVGRAERRLLRVVYREEQRRAAAQHRHPQS